MVPRFAKPGKSFQGVMLYLAHDPEHATTSTRVAWTHTLNLANDDVEAAILEMQTTVDNAGVLKAEHGVGGRKVERPVKHFSLNWHPSETPDQAEMIGAVQSFLKHMGWDQHQAIAIGHNDKAYRHAHVVLNAIHPETGLKLDDGFERRRAQARALAYEQARGQDFCPERGRPAAEREAAEPRPAWMDIKQHSHRAAEEERAGAAFDPSYMAREENRRVLERREWEILKALQRNERLAFFEEGRGIYRDLNRAIYREVREEFRNEWASYYAARREGLDADALKEMRAELIDRQKEVLDERRGDVTAEKRAERDLEYRALLDVQKAERGELIDRQELGLRSPGLLDRAYPHGTEEIGDRLPASEESLDRFGIMRGRPEQPIMNGFAPRASLIDEPLLTSPHGNAEGAPSRDIGTGLAGGVLGALGALGDSLLGGHSKSPPKSPQLERFGVQRGQGPPGDAKERAAREQRQEYEDWHAWKGWHHYEQER
jgi:hypothetical protein